jgi:hypothetical protein
MAYVQMGVNDFFFLTWKYVEFFYELDRNVELVDDFYNSKYSEYTRRLNHMADKYSLQDVKPEDMDEEELQDMIGVILELRSQLRKLQVCPLLHIIFYLVPWIFLADMEVINIVVWWGQQTRICKDLEKVCSVELTVAVVIFFSSNNAVLGLTRK